VSVSRNECIFRLFGDVGVLASTAFDSAIQSVTEELDKDIGKFLK